MPVNVVPARGSAGRDFRIELSGFAPYRPVVLELLQRGNSDELLTRFVMFANLFGSAELQIFSLADDPPGEYISRTGPSGKEAQFIVDPPKISPPP